ncbi:hypothetical protein ACWDG1_41345 [Streptomyces sp. NPDC001177]
MLRRARCSAAQRHRPAEPGSFLRNRVLVALEFIDRLNEHGIAPRELQQE